MERKEKQTPEYKKLQAAHFGIWTAFILLSVLALVWFFGFWRISDISVEGVSFCSENDIIDSSTVITGTHIYAIDKEEIISSILKANPYVQKAEVRRKIPCGIHLVITEYTPCYYTKAANGFAVLSEDLTVLEIKDTLTDDMKSKKAELIMPEMKETAPGQALLFENGEAASFYRKTIAKLFSSSIGKSVTRVDMTQKYEIRVRYKDCYTIIFGSPTILENNIDFCSKIIYTLESNPSYTNVTGTLYAISGEEITFSPD